MFKDMKDIVVSTTITAWAATVHVIQECWNYPFALRITKNCNQHTFSDDMILAAGVEIAKLMFVEIEGTKLRSIPATSNNITQRRVNQNAAYASQEISKVI